MHFLKYSSRNDFNAVTVIQNTYQFQKFLNIKILLKKCDKAK